MEPFKLAATCLSCLLFLDAATGQELYTRTGTDLPWEQVKGKVLPLCNTSHEGVQGSKIEVSPAIAQRSRYGRFAIEAGIQIHTLGNKSVPRSDFGKWSRWYQESGNTQVFRIFKGETTALCNRPNAARVEAEQVGHYQAGAWQEWVSALAVIQPDGRDGCSIFQIKTDHDMQWPVQMVMRNNGDVWAQPRYGASRLIIPNTIGKTFDLKVRDNGKDYENHVDDNLVFKGSQSRGAPNHFRWGMYMGNQAPPKDLMIFFTGANINPGDGAAGIRMDARIADPRGSRQAKRGGLVASLGEPTAQPVVDMLGKLHRTPEQAGIFHPPSEGRPGRDAPW